MPLLLVAAVTKPAAEAPGPSRGDAVFLAVLVIALDVVLRVRWML
jgi:hypothetical protein